MGKQYTGKRIKRRIAPETTYMGSELTDKSDPRNLYSPGRRTDAVFAAFKVGPEGQGRKRPLLDVQTGRTVAWLSIKDGAWCYRIMPGIPGGDGKLHEVGKNRRQCIALCAAKIRGFKVGA